MRAINVSTVVFAEIWKQHKPGDLSEDDILRRLLKLPTALPTNTPSAALATTVASGRVGYQDTRNGVQLPENFEIFRTYKGKEFKARAVGGEWVLLSDNSRHRSLHKLSWAVVKGPENCWYGWKYRGEDGKNHYVTTLRGR